MIRAFTGQLGSGKTLRMVIYCMEEMKKGRTCVSNTKIEFKHKGVVLKNKYCDNSEDFERAILTERNAVIAIDEAGSIFSSQQWNKLSFDMTYRFRVNRKLRCDLVYTAQDFFDVVRPLRKLTDDVVLAYKKRWFGFGRLPRLRKGKIKWDVSSIVFHYSFARKDGFTQSGMKRRNFWEFVKFREAFYPVHYLPAMRAYDTMDIPDPYMMVKQKQGIYKKSQQGKAQQQAKYRQQSHTNSKAVPSTPQADSSKLGPSESQRELISKAESTLNGIKKSPTSLSAGDSYNLQNHNE